MSDDLRRAPSPLRVLVEGTGWNQDFDWWEMHCDALGVSVCEWGFEAAEHRLLAEVRAQLESQDLKVEDGLTRQLLLAEREGELEAVLRDAQTLI